MRRYTLEGKPLEQETLRQAAESKTADSMHFEECYNEYDPEPCKFCGSTELEITLSHYHHDGQAVHLHSCHSCSSNYLIEC